MNDSRGRNKFSVAVKVVVSLLAVSSIVYAIFALITSSVFRIQSLDILPVREPNVTSFDKVKEALRVRLHPLLGQYIWHVDLESVLTEVEKNQLVKSAKIRRVLPNHLQIDVTLHVPIASVMGRRTSEVFPLARDGDLLPPLSLNDAINGPILSGMKFLIHPKLRKEAVRLLLALPKKGWLSLRNISEIYFDKTRGFAMTVSPSGADVWLGSKNFAQHELHAQRVLNYLADRHLTGRIIDARLDEKVVVKLRNAP